MRPRLQFLSALGARPLPLQTSDPPPLQASDLDTGTFKASTTTVILYVVRLCARFDNYVSFLLQYDAGTHDSVRGQPYRQLAIGAAVRAQLVRARAALRGVLLGDLRTLLLGWYHKLSRELDAAFAAEDEEVLDENVRHMCVVHSHLLLMLRNVSAAELTEPLAKTALCAMAFLATRHQWNRELLDEWGGGCVPQPSYDCWRVPENELYEALHGLRRKLVLWLRESATQRQLDAVMGAVVPPSPLSLGCPPNPVVPPPPPPSPSMGKREGRHAPCPRCHPRCSQVAVLCAQAAAPLPRP